MRATPAITFAASIRQTASIARWVSVTADQASTAKVRDRSLLASGATDPRSDVRKNAASSLGEMGAPASLAAPGLQAAASQDPSPAVRSLAHIAISKLTR